jgi:hypothetical protein
VSSIAVRRQTGNEQSVQVRHDEGVAIHAGPEPCVAVRKGGGAASADAIAKAEDNTDGRVNASAREPGVVARRQALLEAVRRDSLCVSLRLAAGNAGMFDLTLKPVGSMWNSGGS